jgi:hypothetical protein
MGANHDIDIQAIDEKFTFSASAKKKFFTLIGVGLVIFVIGLVMAMSGGGDSHGAEHAVQQLNGTELADAMGGGGDAAHAGEGHGDHGGYSWVKRLKVSLWHNALFFVGISVIGIFFVAIQYVSFAGWSVAFMRVPEAMSTFLPIAAVLLVGIFFWTNHDIFHWTHEYLYDKADPRYDHIIDGKKAYLNMPFYLGRMAVILLGWLAFGYLIRKGSRAQDSITDPMAQKKNFKKVQTLAAIFIVFFGITNSVSSWDWIMSIDTHWFSTLFAWYTFASFWVTGIALVTLTVIFLKEGGYFKVNGVELVNENHLHDLGKFVFAFSIFWSYEWFDQFLLIYYSNIPEETIYFIERLEHPVYSKVFFLMLIVNFALPFLGLMTRDAKRKMRILKTVCFIVVAGHWLDFWLMVTPATMKEHGTVGLLEIGLGLTLFGIFGYWVAMQLEKVRLTPKNHPLLAESLNHHT